MLPEPPIGAPNQPASKPRPEDAAETKIDPTEEERDQEGLSQSIGDEYQLNGRTGDQHGAARRSNRLSIARGEEADQDHEDQEYLNVVIR